MGRIHLTEPQWAFIQPLLPPPARPGRPRADDRRTIEAILYILITGCRWQDLPREYGAPTTVWRRLSRWSKEGVWARAALAALDQQGKLDWSMAFLDGSFAPAKKGGEKVGLTKKEKGAKWMLVVEGNGLPLGFHLDRATTAEVRLADATLDTISVPRLRGRPRQRPERLVADRAYDSSAFRHALRRRGIRMCIPPKRLLVIEGAFHLRGRGLLLWPLVPFDALPPPPQISFRRTVTLRQPVSHRSDQAFFQISRIGAHADLPCTFRACLGFSHVALT